MRGLTTPEYEVLRIAVDAFARRLPPRPASQEEQDLVRSLVAQGRCALVSGTCPCGRHRVVRVTAAGLEAMRIYEAERSSEVSS